MWGNPLFASLTLTVILSLFFYKVNLHFLSSGQWTMMLWMVAGVPLFAVVLALMAAAMQPPQSYGAIAALAGLGNGMAGLGLRMVATKFRERKRLR